MDSKINEIDIEDLLADINLELEEISSTIQILCCALENASYNGNEAKEMGHVLFMLTGKLNSVKNKLKYVKCDP
jgi:hypothetical protein